jgi:hypothetical protein
MAEASTPTHHQRQPVIASEAKQSSWIAASLRSSQ